jgi:protein-S-isoprenylcysteine O-methyltransferase Ste14
MWRRVFAVVSYLIGLAGAGIFMLYLLGTGVGVWPRPDTSEGLTPWLVDVSLLGLFALQHSGMARETFKRAITHVILAALERSTYVAASGIVLGIVTLCWQPLPGEAIWEGPVWVVGICLLASVGVAWCAARFDHNRFFGLTQAWTGDADTHGPLIVEGPYRYVRHPLMFGLLIVLWAQPVMPRELFLMNAGWTLYIVLAVKLEERDLVRQYGEEYEKYRSEVPMLIPWRWRRT